MSLVRVSRPSRVSVADPFGDRLIFTDVKNP
jgi:hypothetical protein